MELIKEYLKGALNVEEEVFLYEYYHYTYNTDLSSASVEQDQFEKITQRIYKCVNSKISEHYLRTKITILFLKYFWIIISLAVVLIKCAMVCFGLLLNNGANQLDISKLKSIWLFNKDVIIRYFNKNSKT